MPPGEAPTAPSFPDWFAEEHRDFADSTTALFHKLQALLGRGRPALTAEVTLPYAVPSGDEGIAEYGESKERHRREIEEYRNGALEMRGVVTASAAATLRARREVEAVMARLNARIGGAAQGDQSEIVSAVADALADVVAAVASVVHRPVGRPGPVEMLVPIDGDDPGSGSVAGVFEIDAKSSSAFGA